MWWQYILVFIGAFFFDVVPFPFPPAYTVMTLLQLIFNLNIWWVILIGVLGSILGRYILMLYAPLLANKFLKSEKNEDIKILGQKMNENKWKGQLMILTYSLLPLPTTPLFMGAGISKIHPIYILPVFFVGRLITNTIALHIGQLAEENLEAILNNAFSWNSLLSLIFSAIFIMALFVIDWRTLIQQKRLIFDFKIWKSKKSK